MLNKKLKFTLFCLFYFELLIINYLLSMTINHNNCMICIDSVESYIICNNCDCKLYVHESCFKSWLKLNNSCFICRTQLSTFNNELSAKFKYLNDEFEKFTLFEYFDSLVTRVTVLSNKINNKIIKILLFNGCFALIVFWILSFMLIFIGIKSQSKYLFDYYVTKKISINNYYEIFDIEENLKNKISTK